MGLAGGSIRSGNGHWPLIGGAGFDPLPPSVRRSDRWMTLIAMGPSSDVEPVVQSKLMREF